MIKSINNHLVYPVNPVMLFLFLFVELCKSALKNYAFQNINFASIQICSLQSKSVELWR